MLSGPIQAYCCGLRSVSDVFRFCQDLKPAQRRSLVFRCHPKARAVIPPPGENCWRKVLRAIDSQSLPLVIMQWQLSQGEALLKLLAIDGKVICKNLATLVSLVELTNGKLIMQAVAPGNGQE